MIANTTFRRKDSATDVFQTLTDFCEITLLERQQSGSTAYTWDGETITEFKYEWILLTKKYDGTLSFTKIREEYLWEDLENWSAAAFPSVLSSDNALTNAPKQDSSQLWTISEVCEVLRCAKNTFHTKYKKDPAFPKAFSFGHSTKRYRPDEVMAYIQNMRP